MNSKITVLAVVALVLGALLLFGSSNLIDLSTASVRADATVSAAQLGIKLNDARGVIAPTLVALEKEKQAAEVNLIESQAQLNRAQAGKTEGEKWMYVLCLLLPLAIGCVVLLLAWRWLQHSEPDVTRGAPRPAADPRGDR